MYKASFILFTLSSYPTLTIRDAYMAKFYSRNVNIINIHTLHRTLLIQIKVIGSFLNSYDKGKGVQKSNKK